MKNNWSFKIAHFGLSKYTPTQRQTPILHNPIPNERPSYIYRYLPTYVRYLTPIDE